MCLDSDATGMLKAAEQAFYNCWQEKKDRCVIINTDHLTF